MTQPIWRYVANLGDMTPLDYGGMFLYVDKTGVYAPELVRLEPLVDGKYEVRRVCLDRCELTLCTCESCDGDKLRLTTQHIATAKNLPYPLHKYEEWFAKDLDKAVSCIGCSPLSLICDLCSADPKVRAFAYMAIYDYHGWDNGDSYPNTMTRSEVRKRYRNEIEHSDR